MVVVAGSQMVVVVVNAVALLAWMIEIMMTISREAKREGQE